MAERVVVFHQQFVYLTSKSYNFAAEMLFLVQKTFFRACFLKN